MLQFMLESHQGGPKPLAKLHSKFGWERFLTAIKIDRIPLSGYPETSSSSVITTKGTKDTKRKWPYVLYFLRALRVLRGDKT